MCVWFCLGKCIIINLKCVWIEHIYIYIQYIYIYICLCGAPEEPILLYTIVYSLCVWITRVMILQQNRLSVTPFVIFVCLFCWGLLAVVRAPCWVYVAHVALACLCRGPNAVTKVARRN